MKIGDLPKWMQVIPVLMGVTLAIIGMQIAPVMGLRGSLGPIVRLPVGVISGFSLLAIYDNTKGD